MRRTNSSLGIVLAGCLLALVSASGSARSAAPAGGAADQPDGSARGGQPPKTARVPRRLAALESLTPSKWIQSQPRFPQYYYSAAEARAYELARQNALQERIAGDRLFHEGKVSDAAGHYRHAVKLDVHDQYARFLYARCLSRLGDFTESAAMFEQLRVDRSSIPARETIVGCEYALVLIKLGDWVKACEVWDQAMRDTVSVPGGMLRAAFFSHDETAVNAYQNTHPRLLEKRFAPDNLRKNEMEALCEWVIATYETFGYSITNAEKLAHLQAAVKANPKLPEAQLAYGEMLIDQRQFAEARLALKVASKRGNPLLKKKADRLLYYCDHPAPPKPGESAQ